MKDSYVYVSSWTNFGGTGGLHAYKMDGKSGQLQYLKTYLPEISFGMSILDKERRLLYVLNEAPAHQEADLDGGGGQIYIFRIDPANGDLIEIQHCPSYGANPCYISIDHNKEYLFAAHHGSHAYVTKTRKGSDGRYHIIVDHDDINLCMFPMNDDGTVGEPADIVKHQGWRQTKAIPNPGMHTACISPSGNLIAVVDIAESRIHMYKVDRENNCLFECAAPYAEKHDSLPRYCLFHPTKPYLYVNHEMGSLDINVYRYDESGALEFIEAVSSVPADHQWKYHDEQQDMRMHPSGRYIYDAVNGPEYVSVLEIDEETGGLKLIQNQKLSGQWARSCAVSPDGTFLISTCLMSGDIEVFRIDNDGLLSQTGYRYEQSSPSWSTFFETD